MKEKVFVMTSSLPPNFCQLVGTVLCLQCYARQQNAADGITCTNASHPLGLLSSAPNQCHLILGNRAVFGEHFGKRVCLHGNFCSASVANGSAIWPDSSQVLE
jgi:hypothetical protein